ncbi:hypothetical protein [Massilia orientalis]|uniref:Uncharacterized protein n=1 Tax=Massilia orientalis TaxID=3050128 RepID=A0ACC7MFM6_9BURK|nr:hypothetical protein [Massilia sp. YIM B02787]
MIEVLIMIAVTGALLVVWNRVQVARQIDETDKAVAAHGQLVQSGVNKYINDYRQTLLASATPTIPGFASPLAPTLLELQANPVGNPYLPSGYNLANQLGMTYTVALSLLPAGCTPGVNCTDVTGLVTSTQALIDPTTNRPDGRRVGGLANKIGLDGASSKVGAGTILTGPAGTWPQANPRGNVEGILAIRVGFGSVDYSSLDALLPRDGTRPMTGPLRLGGNPLLNASTISASSTISTTGGNITTDTGSITSNSGSVTTNSGSIMTNSGSITTSTGNITATAGKVTAKYFVPAVQATGGACADNSAIATAVDGTILVCRAGAWRVHAGPIADKGTACTQPGALATTSTTGEAVICRGSTYIALANAIGKYVEVSRQSVMDGNVVAYPTCESGGVPAFRFGMVQTAVDVSSAPPKQVTNLTAAIGPGSAWTVSYKLRDDLGNQTSANVYNLQAVMYLECKYP